MKITLNIDIDPDEGEEVEFDVQVPEDNTDIEVVWDDPDDAPNEPAWSPQFDSFWSNQGAHERLTSAVFQALGAASVCWDSPEAAGTFNSERARDVGNGLIEFLRAEGWSPSA